MQPERKRGGGVPVPEVGSKPVIEILTFSGCPNRERALALVSEILAEAGAEADVRLVDVPDPETAKRTRFLGSPTIRVNGRDIEPGADERREFVLSCRVFRTDGGLTGEPDPRWLHDALLQAPRGAS
jgi:hypothetical protein